MTYYAYIMSTEIDEDARITANDYYGIDTQAWCADEEDE